VKLGPAASRRQPAVPAKAPGSGNAKSHSWHDHPLQKGGETGAEWRQKGHRLGVRPALVDPYIEPFAEDRVAKAEQDGGERHAPAKERPAQKPRSKDGERQRSRGDQRITAGAVEEDDGDVPARAIPRDRIKRQLGGFPQQMTRGRQAQIEKGGACGGVAWHAMARPAYKRTVRRRRALVTTRTELMLIAALAIIGLSRRPLKG
jgi:hypothetical protein